MDKETTWRLMQLMEEGGWVMWALLAFSVVALATATERWLVVRKARGSSGDLARRLREALVREKSVAKALEVSGSVGGPVARMASVALRRFGRSAAHLEQLMERQAGCEQRILYRRMRVLATVATTAPLLGFLGTVTGMMLSFETIGTLGLVDPSIVALGIKEALTTTAAGLTVAVPTQIVHNALSGRVEEIVGDMETVGNVLLEIREDAA